MAFEKINADDTLNQGRIKINNNLDAVKSQTSQLSESITKNYSELKEDLDNASGIDYSMIRPSQLNFTTQCVEQLVKVSELTDGYYNRGTNNVIKSTSVKIVKPIRIKKGIPFYAYHVYGYFCTIIYDDGTVKSLTDETWGAFDYNETPVKDGTLYISISNNYVGQAVVLFGANNHDGIYFEGVKSFEMPKMKVPKLESLNTFIYENLHPNMNITVDGTFTSNTIGFGIDKFNTVKSAIDYINTQSYKYWNVNINSGTYNILEEMGGQTWLNSISHDNGERQGLQIPNHVNLYGVGNVVFEFLLPDTVNYVQSQCVSCINTMGNNRLENIHFKAKNCRYVCHDEMNNAIHYIKRYVKNCKFEHLGNQDGLWEYPSAYGAGTGSGCIYEFYDCEIISAYRPFGIHTNSNQDGCTLIMDRVVATGGSYRQSITISSYGTNHKSKSKAYISNVIADKEIATAIETPTSEDDWILYNFNN